VDGGAPGVNDSGVDIQISLQRRWGVFGGSGGTLTVGPSLDAAYRHHEMDIPPGALRKQVKFTLRAPLENAGVIGAVWVEADDPRTTFSTGVRLWIEYREGDIDWERGHLEACMWVFQLIESPPGRFHYEPVPGSQLQSGAPPLLPFRVTGKLDTATRLVGVNVTSLNPLGSPGTPGVFAGLPIETVDERTITVKPGGAGGIVRGAGSVVLAPGSRGAYILHQIEIPNYVTTSVTDPQRLVVQMRTSVLAERYSATSGQSFPSQSGAVFTVTVTDAMGQPVRFTAPVNLTVQFQDRPNPAVTDVVHFDGTLGPAASMCVVRDRLDGDPVDFAPLDRAPQTVNVVQGTVTIRNLVGLTGTDGRGTFGAVVVDLPPPTPAIYWQLYR
jgi:hypothetical protein